MFIPCLCPFWCPVSAGRLSLRSGCTPSARHTARFATALRPVISLFRPRLALSRHSTARSQLYSSRFQPIPAYSGRFWPTLAYSGRRTYFGSAASSASTAPMLSSAPLSTSSPTAYEKRMHLSSPKAAPGTTATWALSSSRVHSSVELLTLPP